MANKKILWLRKLSCSHERPTTLAFMVGKYDKPKVGSAAFCRECWMEVSVTSVKRCGT